MFSHTDPSGGVRIRLDHVRPRFALAFAPVVFAWPAWPQVIGDLDAWLQQLHIEEADAEQHKHFQAPVPRRGGDEAVGSQAVHLRLDLLGVS